MSIEQRISGVERRLGLGEQRPARVQHYDPSQCPANREGRAAFFRSLGRPDDEVVFCIPDNGRGGPDAGGEP